MGIGSGMIATGVGADLIPIGPDRAPFFTYSVYLTLTVFTQSLLYASSSGTLLMVEQVMMPSSVATRY